MFRGLGLRGLGVQGFRASVVRELLSCHNVWQAGDLYARAP